MFRGSIKSAIVAGVIALLAFSGAGAANAANPSVKVDLPDAAVAAGTVVTVPVALKNFTYTSLTVTITADSGTFTIDDASSLLTLNPGYSSLADVSEVGFHGLTADVVAILADKLAWTSPADPAESLLGLRVEVGKYEEGTSYDPATGHSYKYVSTALSWSAARDAAAAMTFKGKTGYLTSITTDAENTFVANKTGASDIWIGATDDQGFVNDARGAAGLSSYGYNTQTAGDMHWAGGAETGIKFSSGLNNPTQVTYMHWANGEPNNGGGNEGCGVTNYNGDAGWWNDLNCNSNNGYLVEFDTTASQFQTETITFDNITGNDTDSNPAPVEEPTLADTGYNAMWMVALAAALLLGGVQVTRYSRRK